MTVISTPNASLKQPVPIDPISNIKSMPGKRQSLSESSRVRSMADLRLTLRHGNPTHRYLSGILAWRRGSSGRPLARRSCLQAPQSHPRVAKGASGRSSARQPCPQVPQSHPRVANGQPTGPRTVTYRCSYRSLARRPFPQASQSNPGVAKWASGRSSAWDPCPQVPQSHPRVAKHHLTDLRMVPSRCTSRSSARRVGPQVLQGHPRVAKGASGRSLARPPRP